MNMPDTFYIKVHLKTGEIRWVSQYHIWDHEAVKNDIEGNVGAQLTDAEKVAVTIPAANIGIIVNYLLETEHIAAMLIN